MVFPYLWLLKLWCVTAITAYVSILWPSSAPQTHPVRIRICVLPLLSPLRHVLLTTTCYCSVHHSWMQFFWCFRKTRYFTIIPTYLQSAFSILTPCAQIILNYRPTKLQTICALTYFFCGVSVIPQREVSAIADEMTCIWLASHHSSLSNVIIYTSDGWHAICL